MPHRTPIKVAVNTLLRAVQLPFTSRPWLLASVFDGHRWTGRYVFARIEVLRGRP